MVAASVCVTGSGGGHPLTAGEWLVVEFSEAQALISCSSVVSGSHRGAALVPMATGNLPGGQGGVSWFSWQPSELSPGY